MAEQIPGKRARAASVALAVLAGALGTALAAAAVWVALQSPAPPPEQSREQPAEETPTSSPAPPAAKTPATESVTPPEAADPEAPPEEKAEEPPKPPDAESPARVARIAFRIGSSIYVAKEDGTEPQPVTRSSSGPYSLSPDARTLATIDDGIMRFVDVESGKSIEVGPAQESLRPCWEPDSGCVYFRRRADGRSQIWRAERNGGKAVRVFEGQQTGISPDGRVLVVRDGGDPMPDGSGLVHVSVAGGAFRRVRVQGGMPTSVATDGALIFVALSSGDRGSAIVSLKPDGREQRQVAGAVPGLTPAVWGTMCPSPDGSLLAVAAQGDDGYSRAFLLPSGGGELLGLTQRRDTSLHSWSASGRRLFLIEGNAFQGEPTALISLRNDGSRRRTIVTGAE